MLSLECAIVNKNLLKTQFNFENMIVIQISHDFSVLIFSIKQRQHKECDKNIKNFNGDSFLILLEERITQYGN